MFVITDTGYTNNIAVAETNIQENLEEKLILELLKNNILSYAFFTVEELEKIYMEKLDSDSTLFKQIIEFLFFDVNYISRF